METNSVDGSPAPGPAEQADPVEQEVAVEQVIDPRLLVPETSNDDAHSTGAQQTRQIQGSVPIEREIFAWERRLLAKQISASQKSRISSRYLVKSYRPFLNSAIEEVAGIDLPKFLHPERVIFQLGASRWARKELDAFFRALDRKGRYAIKDIAIAVGSKSEVEVQSFLLRLREASDQMRYCHWQRTVNHMKEIPAAAEVSRECCEALEGAADALAWEWEKTEILMEKSKHGENWLLDRKMAAKLNRAYEREERGRQGLQEKSPELASDEDEEGDLVAHFDSNAESHGESDSETGIEDLESQLSANNEVQPDGGADIEGEEMASTVAQQSKEEEDQERAALEHWPAARLFNAPIWLDLCDDLFMRQVPFDGPYALGTCPDWKILALKGQEPSIYHTAFSDFYDLVVSITRRLVQASINQAVSRHRAFDYGKVIRGKPTVSAPLIEQWDVDAAMELLNMPRDRKKFFAGTARKCGLQVSRDSNGTVDYFTLEQTKVERVALKKVIAAQLSDDSSEDQDDLDDDLPNDEHQRSPDPNESSVKKKGSRKRQDVEIEESCLADFNTESWDDTQDRKEERRLWKILGLAPPPEIENGVSTSSGSVHAIRNTRPAVVDRDYGEWADQTDYRPEWETYGNHHIQQTDFLVTGFRRELRRAKRRKTEMDAKKAKAEEDRQHAEQHDQAGNGEGPVNVVDEMEEQGNWNHRADDEETYEIDDSPYIDEEGLEDEEELYADE